MSTINKANVVAFTNVIRAQDILNIINALDGTSATDLIVSGSISAVGPLYAGTAVSSTAGTFSQYGQARGGYYAFDWYTKNAAGSSDIRRMALASYNEGLFDMLNGTSIRLFKNNGSTLGMTLRASGSSNSITVADVNGDTTITLEGTTGAITLANNSAYQSKNTGGTSGGLLYMSSSDVVTLYDPSGFGTGIDIVEANNSPIQLYTNGTKRLIVNGSGQVVVGASATVPSLTDTFTVAGTAKVRGTFIATGSIITSGSVINQYGVIQPCKVYVATFTQAGTAGPTVTVLENSLGGTLQWGYAAVGIYTGSLTNGFPDGARAVIIPGSVNGIANTGNRIHIERTDSNKVTIYTGTNGAAANDVLDDTSIMIKVYP